MAKTESKTEKVLEQAIDCLSSMMGGSPPSIAQMRLAKNSINHLMHLKTRLTIRRKLKLEDEFLPGCPDDNGGAHTESFYAIEGSICGDCGAINNG